MQVLKVNVYLVGNDQVILHVYGVNPQGNRFMIGSAPLQKSEIFKFLIDLPKLFKEVPTEPGQFTGKEDVPF